MVGKVGWWRYLGGRVGRVGRCKKGLDLTLGFFKRCKIGINFFHIPV